MRVAREETFGPVAPLSFSSEAEAIALAITTPNSGWRPIFIPATWALLSRRRSASNTAWWGNTGDLFERGGALWRVKQSGLGREGSKYGIDDYLEIKYLCFDLG